MLPRLARRARQFASQPPHLWRQLGSLPAPPLLQLQSCVTPAVCAQLDSDGFAVVDGAVPPELVAALRQELLSLGRGGLLHANCTHLVRGGATQLLEKAHIREAELTIDPRIAPAAPLFARIDADSTLATLLSLFLPQLTLDSQVGVGGGGAFGGAACLGRGCRPACGPAARQGWCTSSHEPHEAHAPWPGLARPPAAAAAAAATAVPCRAMFPLHSQRPAAPGPVAEQVALPSPAQNSARTRPSRPERGSCRMHLAPAPLPPQPAPLPPPSPLLPPSRPSSCS
jgi:hypothetical protein